MKPKLFEVSGVLEIFEEYTASWTYLFIPFKSVPDVDPGGWGAIPIEVTVGKTTWVTSMFPLKKSGYFIPIKKLVQKKENIKAGDKITAKYFTTRGNFD